MRRRLAALALAAVTVLPGCGGDAIPLERAAAEPTRADGAAVSAGQRFLDHHVDPDGRVVRHDQGGDTVSEGQAYALLVAVALGDETTFRRVWSWTQAHLQRDDGLLSWRWADGAVADPMPATDADVDTAHALTRAASRFGDPAFADEARRIADAVLAHATVQGRLGPVAVAGPWATHDERWVNASYGDPVAYEALALLTDDGRWEELDDAARRVVEGSSTTSDLPADWAVLTSDAVEPRGAPGSGAAPVHGYDAVRTAVRFAIDCQPAGRELAAAMDDEYDEAALEGGAPAAVLDLDGRPLVEYGHPTASVAAAAASLATGDRDDADRLLLLAEDQLERGSSYYGSAWVALGRLWLTTDRLGGCAG